MLSSERAMTLMNSQQLWLPARDRTHQDSSTDGEELRTTPNWGVIGNSSIWPHANAIWASLDTLVD